jgi:hypothetical protein
MFMKSNEVSTDIATLICENLPEDWEIQLVYRRGEMEVALYDPDCELVDMADLDIEQTVDQMVRARINHARETDGLCPI